jgi:diadenylate cyclase
MDLLSYFQPYSVIDILLVSFLLYQLYLWVRESRALRALAGLAVIGVLSLLARWTGMVMTGWLFQSLWSIILLVIVIVFQPEIRRILERMNPLDLLRGQLITLRRETLVEITETVFDMAREKVGALIVIPGRDPIDEYLREGVALEAIVSRELIRTLFQPPSPTHDGAIVVRANRVERAACFLPMTTATGLPSEYGARHRAAIGLTERCDAVCLLVSEERGTVALARKGTLIPFFEPARLQQELEQELQDTLSGDADKRDWRAMLTGNLWAKGMAVGLAGLLWVALAGQQSSEIAMTIPIEYQQIAPTIELRGEVPREVNVRLRGSQLALEAMRSRPVRARVSLAQVRDGINPFPVTKNQIDLPAGVEITEIRPAFLLIEVQKKEVPAPPSEQQ